MSTTGEKKYPHFILYAIIAILVYILIKVAYFDPNEIMEKEKYFKKESRTRMINLREAERLWGVKYGRFTDNLDSLILFVKNDPSVKKAVEGTDPITGKPTNPFNILSIGSFEPDSLYRSPKSFKFYILQVDTSVSTDTIIDRRGRIIKIENLTRIGQRYFLACPDGYGTVGDLRNDAMKNTASWE